MRSLALAVFISLFSTSVFSQEIPFQLLESGHIQVKAKVDGVEGNFNAGGFRAQFVEGLIYDGIMWINWLGSAITVDIPGKMLLVKR